MCFVHPVVNPALNVIMIYYLNVPISCHNLYMFTVVAVILDTSVILY